MSVPENLRYSESHEWVHDDGEGVVTIGITDFAQEKMTELVYVELPDPDHAKHACWSALETSSDFPRPVEFLDPVFFWFSLICFPLLMHH